ncbi:DUF4240 domain-containing protein [Streptomyces sp. NPDC054940]
MSDMDSVHGTVEQPRSEGWQTAATVLQDAAPNRLSVGPLATVIGFAEQLSWALYRLDRKEYGHDLSSDSFLYTRAAVVAAGREAYEAVLTDPQLFTPYARDLIWAESLLYAPYKAYRRITGDEWDRSTRHSYESYSNTAGWTDA